MATIQIRTRDKKCNKTNRRTIQDIWRKGSNDPIKNDQMLIIHKIKMITLKKHF